MQHEQLSQLIKDVAESVRAADLPDPWAVEAFKLVLAAGLAGEAAEPWGGSRSLREVLAGRLGLPEAVLEDVIGVEGGTLTVRVPADRLTTNKSAATRELALLVCATEQIGGAAFTSSDSIRRTVVEYDRYDQKNFASSLKVLRDAVTVRGPSSTSQLRLTRLGWEQVALLVRRLADAQR